MMYAIAKEDAPATSIETQASAARSFAVGLMAFLTVVDLFAAQALLPSLVKLYQVSPAAMSLAVNACTLGMAIAGIAVALFSKRLDKRLGVVFSLALLAVPTVAMLRIVQGVLMVTAFSLTLAHLGERYSAGAGAGIFAAYITGNVASNLIGRLISATVLDHAGLAAAFYVFAGLNILGAILAYAVISKTPPMSDSGGGTQSMQDWTGHFRNGELRAAFGIGFCILYAFIGTFTFVNFVLVKPPLSVSMTQLGVIYFVFLPSIITTPFAGRAARCIGLRRALWLSFAIAGSGLPMLLAGQLPVVLAGMVLVAAGTFFAQALATGFVNRAAKTNRSAASGIYLAAYFLGGLAGTAILGQIFDRAGWTATVAGIGVAIALAAALVFRLDRPEREANTLNPSPYKIS
jgi:MFS transporter, YNFM family, putative membrane transport protein